MRYVITSLLVLCSLIISAQGVKIQGQKRPQTQVTKPKAKTGSAASKPKQPTAVKPKSSAGKASHAYTTKPVGGSVGVAVDLGLPSGTLWADRNVGADRPEDYGDYFAWGEVKPKSTYTWSTYKYSNDSKGNKFSKYVATSGYGNVDSRTTLDLHDDAAYVNWGSSWRMPTKGQQDELGNSSYTTWTWTTRNGVDGYEVKSKRNGNSIFLPAAGYCGNSSLGRVGSDGLYWSSSLTSSDSSSAYGLYFYSSYVGNYSYGRVYGRSVRPVRSE